MLLTKDFITNNIPEGSNLRFMISNNIDKDISKLKLLGYDTIKYKYIDHIDTPETFALIRKNNDCIIMCNYEILAVTDIFNGRSIFSRYFNILDLNNLTVEVHKLGFSLCKIDANELKLGGCKFKEITDLTSFLQDSNIRSTVDLSGMNVENVEDLTLTFASPTRTTKIKSLNFTGWQTKSLKSLRSTFFSLDLDDVLDVSMFDVSRLENMMDTFSGLKCRGLNVSGWNVKNLLNMNRTFLDAEIDGDLDLSTWRTEWLTSMQQTFKGLKCNNLKINNLNVSAISDMRLVFAETNCNDIDISSWDTSDLRQMDNMFCYCNIKNNIDLHELNLCDVTDMYQTFKNCKCNTLNLSSVSLYSLKVSDELFVELNCDTLDLSYSEIPKLRTRNIFKDAKINKIMLRGCDAPTIANITTALKNDGVNTEIIF